MKLSKELKQQLNELDAKISEVVTDLNAEVEVLRRNFEGRSEKWQESEAGSAAEEQIDAVEALAEGLENTQLVLVEVLENGA